ncbi:site-specific DNA-methyltransferase, partial [Bacillus sp. SIMBA_161]
TDIVDSPIQNKTLDDYHLMLEKAFKELYRILKNDKWMTVEFSNTKAEIWNGIQNALNKAGFIIASVSALNKKQGSFKSVTT